jgi:hypothetical protein
MTGSALSWPVPEAEAALLASFALSAWAELGALGVATSPTYAPAAPAQVLAAEAALVVTSSFMFLAVVASGPADDKSRAVLMTALNLTFLVLSMIGGHRAAAFPAEAAPATLLAPEAACVIAASYMALGVAMSVLMSVYDGLSRSGFKVALCCAFVAHASCFSITDSEESLPAAVLTLQTLLITDSFLLFVGCFTASSGLENQAAYATLLCIGTALTSSIAAYLLVLASVQWQHYVPRLDLPVLPASLSLQTGTGAKLHLLRVPERFRRRGLGCTVASWALSLACMVVIAAQSKGSSKPGSRQPKSRRSAAEVPVRVGPAPLFEDEAHAQRAVPAQRLTLLAAAA